MQRECKVSVCIYEEEEERKAIVNYRDLVKYSGTFNRALLNISFNICM